jgi:uncharacterized protein (TIGR00730 family)
MAKHKRAQPNINVPASDLPLLHQSHDFRNSFHWRVFRIVAEFVEGWQFLSGLKRSVTIFGSARLTEDNHWYGEARKLGKLLSDAGFGVITGGGPGIMEAANRGAAESGKSDSIGLDIRLPFEQRENVYVEKSQSFHYFFVRKVMLSYAAQAYIYFPGGFGTLDELTEIITLIQTRKIPVHIPVILVGREFWTPFLDWIDKTVCLEYGAVSPSDHKIYRLVDSAEEAMKLVKKSPLRKEF